LYFEAVSRFIRAIFSPTVGEAWTNQEMLAAIKRHFESLDAPAEKKKQILDFVSLLLIGDRQRYVQHPGFLSHRSFRDHASAYARAVNESVAAVTKSIREDPVARTVKFDAVVGVSSGGQLLPGIAERIADANPDQVPRSAMLFDICNGGCTGSSRALQLATSLVAPVKNVLVLVLESSSLLADPWSLELSNWQGVCTFADGTAAMWLSSEAGDGSAELRRILSHHGTESDLIHWGFGTNYLKFGLGDPEHFDAKVKGEVLGALTAMGLARDLPSRWAIHPAGIMLLLSLAKKLGIDRAALEPSINHFRNYSNMSSVSILHILKEVIAAARAEELIRWLAMGAGFHIMFGEAIKHS
jgi:predicted naringenin-chalcone synthase